MNYGEIMEIAIHALYSFKDCYKVATERKGSMKD
jgi:hypothetical protein